MTDRLKNKVALVFGAGSIGEGWGNGKATSVLFAREGAKVFAVDLNGKAAEETVSIIQSEKKTALAHQANIANAEQVTQAVAECIKHFGQIDILVNNVGIARMGGLEDVSLEEWDTVHNINLKGFFLTCQQAVPHMVKQGGGSIINISSIAAIRWTGVKYLTYASSKAALLQLTQSIALEYASQKVRANALLPGLMKTPMVREGFSDAYSADDIEEMYRIRDAQCPMGHMGDAWDVANAALFLASNESRYITGQQLIVDGGISCKIS